MLCRFSGVQGIVAFDFDNFMSMVQRSRKWQDPHTLRNVTVKQLQLDPWMQTVLTCLQVTILPASKLKSTCRMLSRDVLHLCPFGLFVETVERGISAGTAAV